VAASVRSRVSVVDWVIVDWVIVRRASSVHQFTFGLILVAEFDIRW